MSIHNQNKQYYHGSEGLSDEDIFEFLDRVEDARNEETPIKIQSLLKSSQEKQPEAKMSKKEIDKELKTNTKANPPKLPWELSEDEIDSYSDEEEDSQDLVQQASERLDQLYNQSKADSKFNEIGEVNTLNNIVPFPRSK